MYDAYIYKIYIHIKRMYLKQLKLMDKEVSNGLGGSYHHDFFLEDYLVKEILKTYLGSGIHNNDIPSCIDNLNTISPM